jgi:hypothetical protein
LIVLKDFNEAKPYLTGQYDLSFSNFDFHQHYKVDFPGGGQQVRIEKLKMYQFFVNSRKEFKHFLHENHQITITLSRNGETIGKTDLEIIDFLSPIVKHKSFYKVMSSSATVLGYLNCQVAIEEDEYIDVMNIPLRNFSGIFIPPEDFLLCLPLPNEWFEILPTFNSQTIPIQTHIVTFKPPAKSRAQSAKPKHSRRPLSRTTISSRPRSCTNKDKYFKLSLEVHTVNGICDCPDLWKVFISMFSEKFMKSEVTRSDVFVYFKTKAEVYLKGNPEEIEKCLESEKSEIRLCGGSELGRSFVNIEMLKGKKSVEDMVPVEFNERKAVFLEFVLSLQEVKLRDFVLGPAMPGGACLLKNVVEMKELL